MAVKTPIRGVFDGSTATGLAEFQSGDFIALTHGGLGASLSIGSAGQVLKVNSGASALEFGSVEALVNIDGATNLESATLAVGDKLLLSDGGTEGRVLLSQLDTLYSGTTKTLTNKTISGSANTLSNIGNSSLSNSSVNFGGITVALGASDTTPAFDLTDATNYPTSSLTGTITNAQLAGSIANDKLAGSIANSKLANSSFTLVDTSSTSTQITLGETLKIQGTTNEVNTSVSGDTITIGLPDNVTIAGDLTINGTTTTVSSTNTTLADSLLELNSGATSNANDTGIIMERGSTGDNAIMFWDESADEFVVGTTTATADSTGNISHTKADFEAATIRGTSGEFISTGISDVITVIGTGDGDGEGPDIVIKRNSASPADDDVLGALVFKGENDADQAVTYGKIRAKILDVTDGTEDGQLEFMAETAGVITSLAKLDSTGLYLNTGLTINFEGDGADAHELTLTVADSLDGDRIITLPNVTGTAVTTGDTGSVTNAMLAGSIANAKLANSSITVTDGSNSTATALGGTITFTAGEGMDVTEGSGTITFAGEDATTSNKGVASFSSDNFAVSSGAVTIKDSGIVTAEIADDAVTAAKLANTSVSAASYGSSTAIPVITVDAQGRLTAASTASISTDLTLVDDASTSATISLATDTLKISGGTGTTSAISGDTLTVNLDNTAVSAASYGSATAVPVITVDAQGRITAASTATTLANVVEDTTPQLGGNLDVQAREITTSTSNGNIKVTPEGTGLLEVKGNDNAGTIQLNCEQNSHGVKLKGPTHSAAQSYTLTLPSSVTNGYFLKTDGSGNLSFAEVPIETKPTVSDVSQTIAPDTATTISIAGTNFVTVPVVDFIKTTGAVTRANTVSFTNSTTLSVNVTLGSGQYHVRVENPDGNAGRSTNNILTASTAPAFSTSSGSLGSVAAGETVSIDVDASSDSTVAFSETTSVLTSNSNTPAGTMNLTLNSSTGVISGTAPSPTSETTYNFTLRATDAESQTADRDFSITISVGMTNSGQFN